MIILIPDKNEFCMYIYIEREKNLLHKKSSFLTLQFERIPLFSTGGIEKKVVLQDASQNIKNMVRCSEKYFFYIEHTENKNMHFIS
jgi:hypothetical protein